MSSISKQIFDEFRKGIGTELKRVLLEKNLTLEEAVALSNRPNKNLINNIELGRSKSLFMIFALCALYGKHLRIELVD